MRITLSRGQRGLAMPLFVSTVALAISLGMLTRVPYQLSGAVLVAPVLVLISVPFLNRAKRREPDAWIARLFFPALAAMLLAAIARYWVSFDFYRGQVDATIYARDAVDVADQLRSGILLPTIEGGLVGSGLIILVTGIMFAVIGPSMLGAFMLWAWLGYWGLYFCYRAFRDGVPEGDHRRYAVLIFFLPSLLFWTAAIGKEAWMMMSIGLTLWGAARLLGRRGAFLGLLVAGLLGTALVRPHITVLLYGALVIALMLRRGLATDRLGPIVKFVMVLLLIPVGLLLLDWAGSFLDVDTFNTKTVQDLLDDRTRLTADIGISTFTAVRATTPLDAPYAAVSVLFRPFPWEATNLQLMLSAVEGALLAGLAVLSARRWIALPFLHSRTYVIMSLTFIVGFVVAFSTLGNFGLLVRERIMVLPLLFVLLALPRATKDAAAEPEPDARPLVGRPSPHHTIRM